MQESRDEACGANTKPIKGRQTPPILMVKPNMPCALSSSAICREAGRGCMAGDMAACPCHQYSSEWLPGLKTLQYQLFSKHITVSMVSDHTFQEPLSRCVFISPFGINASLSSWQPMCNFYRKQHWGRSPVDSYCRSMHPEDKNI